MLYSQQAKHALQSAGTGEANKLRWDVLHLRPWAGSPGANPTPLPLCVLGQVPTLFRALGPHMQTLNSNRAPIRMLL